MTDIFEYADELGRQGRLAEELAEYGDLTDAYLGGIEPLMRRADLLQRHSRLSEAQADLELAAEIDPTSGWPLLRLAQMAQAKGKLWLAATYVREALNRQPDTAEIRVNAAAIYSALDWLDLSFRVVRSLPYDMADWWGDMRRNAERQYRDHHAKTLASLRGRRRDANTGLAALPLALDLLRLGRLHLARKLCESSMRETPVHFQAFDLYSKILARETGPAEALSFFQAITFLLGHTSEHDEALRRARRELTLSDIG